MQPILSALSEISTLQNFELVLFVYHYPKPISGLKNLNSLEVVCSSNSYIRNNLKSTVIPAMVASPQLKRFVLFDDRIGFPQNCTIGRSQREHLRWYVTLTSAISHTIEFCHILSNLKNLTLVRSCCVAGITVREIWNTLRDTGSRAGFRLETLDTLGDQG